MNTTGACECVCVCVLRSQSCPTLVTLRTVAHQAPLPVGIPKQEYWSGLWGPSPGDLPSLGIQPKSLEHPALAGGCVTTAPPGKSYSHISSC